VEPKRVAERLAYVGRSNYHIVKTILLKPLDLIDFASIHILERIALHDFMSKDLDSLNAHPDVRVIQILDVKGDVGRVSNHPLE